MLNKYRGGALKSPVTRGEIVFEDVVPNISPLPVEIDLRPYLPAVKNQGEFPICAAMTGSTMMEYIFNRYHYLQKPEIYSQWFIYNNRQENKGEGMFGYDVMNILHDFGDCKDETYSPSLIETKDSIPQKAYKEAKKYCTNKFYRVTTVKGAKVACFINGCCYISFPLKSYGKEFWKADLNTKEDVADGGHAVTMCGYNKDGFIIRNSWGSSWGDRGYCVYPFDDFGIQWEIWTLHDAKFKDDECCCSCF